MTFPSPRSVAQLVLGVVVVPLGLAATVCPHTVVWPPFELRAGAGPSAHREAIFLRAANNDHVKSGKNGTARPGAFLPLFSSLPLYSGGSAGRSPQTNYPEVTRALVFLHGLGANADVYFKDGLAIAEANSPADTTLVVAPWFGNEIVSKEMWFGNGTAEPNPATVSLCFRHAVWSSGGDDETQAISSFSALDELVNQLKKRMPVQISTAASADSVSVGEEASGFSHLFPNLKEITISGFSAGCQSTSRWAFFSDALLPLSTEAELPPFSAENEMEDDSLVSVKVLNLPDSIGRSGEQEILSIVYLRQSRDIRGSSSVGLLTRRQQRHDSDSTITSWL